VRKRRESLVVSGCGKVELDENKMKHNKDKTLSWRRKYCKHAHSEKNYNKLQNTAAHFYATQSEYMYI